MKLSSLFFVSSIASLASASAIALDNEAFPAGASISLPRSSLLSRFAGSYGKPKKDNWGNAVEKDRRKIKIRASKNDHDDISSDFLWALKKANHGGLVYLEKGKKYVIGKKLDLTFLKDVYVKLDGELKVIYIYCIGMLCVANQVSSRTISITGKPTISTTTFRRALRSGFGVGSKTRLNLDLHVLY